MPIGTISLISTTFSYHIDFPKIHLVTFILRHFENPSPQLSQDRWPKYRLGIRSAVSVRQKAGSLRLTVTSVKIPQTSFTRFSLILFIDSSAGTHPVESCNDVVNGQTPLCVTDVRTHAFDVVKTPLPQELRSEHWLWLFLVGQMPLRTWFDYRDQVTFGSLRSST